MKSFDLLLLAVIASLICIGTFGCGKTSTELKTIQGLQEQNKVLLEQIEFDKNNRVDRKTDLNSQIQKLIDEHTAIMTRQSELNQKQVSLLHGEIASLRLELGAAQRERLTFREHIDREPRIEEAKARRNRADIFVMVVLLVISLLALAFVVIHFRSVRDRLNLFTMQQVSELRRLGGGV